MTIYLLFKSKYIYYTPINFLIVIDGLDNLTKFSKV